MQSRIGVGVKKARDLRRLRVAVIGLGAWGTRAHLAALAARDDVEVVAIVEPDAVEAAAAAARFSVPRIEADAAMLWANPGEIDAVVIATPVDTHYRQVMDALAAGCHVLCEKPLAYDLPQAEEMHRVAREAGVVAKLGFLMRFSPVVARMKVLVDEGYLGELRGFEFHSVNAQFIDPDRPRHWKMERSRANGGVFAEYGSHGIDLALWFGGPITKVVAHGTTAISERPLHGGGRGAVDVDDMTAWIGVYANGGDATFRTGWASQPIGGGGVRIYGSRGSLAWQPDPTTRRSEVLIGASTNAPEPTVLLDHTPDFDPVIDSGPFPLGLFARYNAGLIDSFIRDIRAGRVTGPSFDDGLAVQRVLAGIRTSLDEGRWVEVG